MANAVHGGRATYVYWSPIIHQWLVGGPDIQSVPYGRKWMLVGPDRTVVGEGFRRGDGPWPGPGRGSGG